MDQDDQDQAAAYVKLHEDVHNLILNTIYVELSQKPHGLLANYVKHIVNEQIRTEIQSYRMTYKGCVASSY